MKNSHIVLLSLLFVSSFVIPADPSANPQRIIKKKGHFDNCFDSGWEFSKCAGKGTAVAAVGVGGLALGGGVLITAYGAVSSGIAAGSAAYAAGAGLGGIASASAAGAGVGGSAATAASIKATLEAARQVQSAFSSPAAAPKPVPTPAKQVEAPKQLEAPKKEDNNPPKKDEDDLTWKKVRNTAVLGGVTAAVGVPAFRIMGHLCDRVEEALPSNKKKKAHEEELRWDQIKREAEESAVQRLMHCQNMEQNAKLQYKIGNLDAKLDAMFICREDSGGQ